MVVQHNLTAMNSNRMLGITTNAQSKSAERLSSGYRINRAADDAAGLTISEKMRKQIKGLNQASTNAQDGISCVQTAEGALTEVHSMLQRMNELSVQAANGTMSEDDRKATQDEINQLVTEIDRVAETTKFNEIYLLKGAEGTEKTVTSITQKIELTQAAKDAEKGTLSVIAGQDAYAPGATAALTGGAAATPPTGASMALEAAYQGGGLYASATGAAVGTAGGDFVEVTAANLTTFFTVDNAGTVTLKAGITAATGTAGNAALINAGGGTAVTNANVATYVKGTAASAGTPAVASDIDEYVEVAEDGSLKYKDGKMLYTVAADGTTPEYGDQKKATMIAEDDLKNYFESSANPLTDSNGDKITDYEKYFVDGVYQGGIFRNDTAGVSQEIGVEQIEDYIKVDTERNEGKTADALEFNLHVGSESDKSNKINVKIESMSAAGIGVFKLKSTGLMTEDAATKAIDTISEAIAKVSEQRSALGAIQNRLEHTIANLDNVVENTTAAESRIRDTDMAEEMVTYSKNNILAQAGQSMLAQANQSTQGVLSLLQ